MAPVGSGMDNFTDRLDLDFGGADEPMDAALQQLPARWAVYLMTDADDRPIQLLCVKNLRASLKRRLGGEEMVGPTRRVNYRDLVRRIYWRRVDSALEADWVYYEAARAIFPDSYAGMTGFRQVWWVHVNPQTNYPRYTRTNDPTAAGGVYLGPIEDKHAAARYVHAVEALFDLCRDYRLLTQAPHGGPCAWRQMGKCVGPCDGSISLSAYRQLIAHSVDVLSHLDAALEIEQERMRSAAVELQFETAARIKQFIDQLSALGKSAFRFVRPLADFRYVSLQHGPGAGKARLLLLTPGRIEHIASFIGPPNATTLDHLLQTIAAHCARAADALTQAGAERLSLAAHHLLGPRGSGGVFLHLPTDPRALAGAYRDLLRQKAPKETDDEGVLKDLQSMA
jgi:excinuclease UvrABC nuclease subunit